MLDTLPETPEEWTEYRKEKLAEAKTYPVKNNKALTRDHPLIQLFLATKTFPDRWKFWFEKSSIWAQEWYMDEWIGDIIKIRPDGVWELKDSVYEKAVK